MKRTTHRVLGAIGAAGLAATLIGTGGAAHADDTSFVNPANGHVSTYTAVDTNLTWQEARDEAAATPPPSGCANHLAAITSQAEEGYIDHYFGYLRGDFLGAQRDESGDFSWITGEKFDYTNWAPGQPDDYQGDESYLQFNNYLDSNLWNDIDGGYRDGYLLETECPAQRAVVTTVSPASGPATGGQQVTLTGEHFTGARKVTFGGKPAADFQVVSDTQIDATTPAYTGAVPKKGKSVQVRVQTTGSNVKSQPARYRYTPSPR